MIQSTTTPTDISKKCVSNEQVRTDVNALLETIFSVRRDSAEALSPRYAALWDATDSYILAGGKRIRPYLTVLGYQLFGGGEYYKILHVATAQELLNQALLMHDDIIDRDFIRYGIPNVAGQFRSYYKEKRGYSEVQSRHYANAAAMLAGDLCISEAFLQIRQAGFSHEQTALLHDYIHEAMFTVAGGELLDSETYGANIIDTNPMLIAHHKTAIYSVVIPLLSGASVAGASKDDLTTLRTFGEKLGVAYQLADDMLGVFGNTEVTGKSTIGDLREGKHTYMMQQTWQRVTPEQRMILEQLFGKADLTFAEAEIIRDIIHTSGAKQQVEEMISELVADTTHLIDNLDTNDEPKQALREFCYSATQRDK